jgi:bacterial/archaeal transporter family-2 protein
MQKLDELLAFSGGILLVLMMSCNGIIAKYSSPVFSSWVIHGVGAISAFAFVRLFTVISSSKTMGVIAIKGPVWSYFGGVPGALSVVLSAISINSPLKLAGTFALMLVGQIMFGIICDQFGLFGMKKRNALLSDFFVVLLVLTGSGIIIFFRA